MSRPASRNRSASRPARSVPIATITWDRPAGARPNPASRVGSGIWDLLTSVNFAVLQIIVLALLASIGMTIRQLPDFAFRSPTDYANQMAVMHVRYDAAFGTAVVDAMERLQLFRVFSSVWFTVGLTVLLISIVACTLDRTPRLWRGVRDIRVIQPDPYFDPRLPDRAAIAGVQAGTARAVLRRHHFRVREATDGVATYLYGDRHQYTKLATLLTHAGLITFILAAAITSRIGLESGLLIAEGESATVQPIGTPDLLIVKNYAFEAPGIETGQPLDFTTDLGVFQNGVEIARKTVRVNDPLSVAGFTFHENGFGVAPDLVVRDRAGAPLWSGPVPLTDQAAGLPYGQLAVPGRDVGLELLLKRDADGSGVILALPFRVTGTKPDGSPEYEEFLPVAPAIGETSQLTGLDLSLEFRTVAQYTIVIAKRDPGQGIVWLAFMFLISGLLITFYLPRRRIWARVSPAGDLAIVGRSDRYVDFEREFGSLLDDLVASRAPAAERAG